MCFKKVLRNVEKRTVVITFSAFSEVHCTQWRLWYFLLLLYAYVLLLIVMKRTTEMSVGIENFIVVSLSLSLSLSCPKFLTKLQKQRNSETIMWLRRRDDDDHYLIDWRLMIDESSIECLCSWMYILSVRRVKREEKTREREGFFVEKDNILCCLFFVGYHFFCTLLLDEYDDIGEEGGSSNDDEFVVIKLSSTSSTSSSHTHIMHSHTHT